MFTDVAVNDTQIPLSCRLVESELNKHMCLWLIMKFKGWNCEFLFWTYSSLEVENKWSRTYKSVFLSRTDLAPFELSLLF